MKKIIVAIVLLATIVVLESVRPAPQPTALPTALPTVQPVSAQDDHRIWVAEQVIERVTNRINRLTAACDRGRMFVPKAAEFCTTELAHFRSKLKIIREVAASGNDMQWNKVIDIVHKFEADTEDPLHTMERILSRL